MQTNLKRVVIIGTGWLGHALKTYLVERGVEVESTSRQPKAGADILKFNVPQSVCEVTLKDAHWVFCIPPGRQVEAQKEYTAYLESALEHATRLNAKQFIMCSTTAVYPEGSGIYNEMSPCTAGSSRQQRLLNNETLVKKKFQNYSIVRLGGLLGPNRHPGRFLAGKTLNSSGNATINMLHQVDAIKGLTYMIENDITQPIVNLVTPHHPSKQSFYSFAAELVNAEAPVFSSDEKSERLIASRVIADLGYQFEYDDLFSALRHC